MQVLEFLEPFGVFNLSVFELLLGCVVFLIDEGKLVWASEVIPMSVGFLVLRKGMFISSIPGKSLHTEETE